MTIERVLEIAAGLSLAVALVASLTGNGIRIGSWLLPVRELWRPIVLGGVLVGCRALIERRDELVRQGRLQFLTGEPATAPAATMPLAQE